jgi:HAD superfamily hydrolase (TIGR01509 family)
MHLTDGIEAVIFDCDGVLVDSELLGNTVLAQVLTEHGLPMTTRDSLRTFVGCSLGGIVERASALAGRDLRDACERVFMGRLEDAFRTQLRAIAGMSAVVGALAVPRAVASNSPLPRLTLSLEVTGLHALFGAHIYSRDHVAQGKPAPDLFLHAAARLGVPPSRCLVIEDGVTGVQAAARAGMRCVGFAGGGHSDDDHVARLREQGVELIAATAEELGGWLAPYSRQAITVPVTSVSVAAV